MMFEISHDLVPALITISLYMTFAGAHLLHFMVQESGAANRHMSQKKLSVCEQLSGSENLMADHNVQRRTWITRIMKRKEGPEDDSDYLSFSNPSKQQIRGGILLWKKDLYSPVFQNIANSL
ncbi:hypothetical protein [Salipaludibacillus neizhouensis]|uniref:hypothetical protein n=1 Tax=Salipaludibacillus neizhouensis TaxID=885475 RepID=UPI0011C449C3|nr:hypothetical protein [Salipaludibacillus neizhouensis]